MGETIYGYPGKAFFQQGDTTRGCYRPNFNVLSVDLPGAAVEGTIPAIHVLESATAPSHMATSFTASDISWGGIRLG